MVASWLTHPHPYTLSSRIPWFSRDPPGPEAGSYHYPSLRQAADGSLHASYSYHLNRKDLPKDGDGDPAAKTIRPAHFNEAWVMVGDA